MKVKREVTQSPPPGVELPRRPPSGSAGSQLRAGRPGDKHLAVVSCVKSPLLSCIPQGAFLLLSEDVALPQEEEGTSCYWMCGLRLSGIFSMPRSQLWERGMRLRFPGLGQPRVRPGGGRWGLTWTAGGLRPYAPPEGPAWGLPPRPGWGASVAEEEARACPPGEWPLLLSLGGGRVETGPGFLALLSIPIRAGLESSVPQGGWS